MKAVALGLLAVLVGMAVLWLVFQGKPQRAELTSATRRSLTQALDEDGLVRSHLEVDLSPTFSGRLLRIAVQPGQKVRKGQVLAEFEPFEQQAALEQARAQEKAAANAVAQAREQWLLTQQRVEAEVDVAQAGVTTSQARLSQVEAGVRAEQKAALQAAYDGAKVRAQESRRDFERRKVLFERGAVSRVDLETFESNMKAADYALRQAQARLEEARRGAVAEDRQVAQAEIERSQASLRASQAQARQAEVAQAALAEAEARLDSARAQVRQGEARLNLSQLLAPADGVVETEAFEAGEVVNPGQVVLRVTDPQKIYVELLLDEGDRAQAKVGAEVRVVSDAYPDQPFQGILESIETQAFLKRLVRNSPTQDEDRVFRARVRLKEGVGKLFPGMSVYAQVVLGRRQEALTIPRQACINREGQWIVYRVQAGKARRRVIEVGEKDSSYIEVLKGLSDGDKVVMNPGALSDGERVEEGAP